MGTVPSPNIVEAANQISLAPRNALEEYARVAGLKQQTALAQQQTQDAALKNQQQQLQLQDQQAMTKALHDWDGQDMAALPDLMRKNGISAPGYLQAQQQVVARKTSLAQLDKDQLANMAAHHDAALGVIDSHKQVPDDQLSESLTGAVQQLQAQGHLSPQEAQAVTQHAQSMPPDQFRPWLDIYEKGLKGEKAATEEAIKDREATAKETNAAAEQTKAESGVWKEAGQGTLYNTKTGQLVHGTPGIENQELAAYLNNPKMDAGIQKDAATFAQWKAKQSPLAQIQVAQSAGGGMNKDAVDQAAEYYHMTGKLPPGGRGVAGLAQNRQIMNRASELYPGSMTADTAEYAANKASLQGLQKQFDQVSAFENTAGKNLDVFLDQAKKVVDSGSPWINKPLRSLNASALGSEDQAAFNTARTTALTEIAKVLNSSNASGVLSDSARHEVEGLIGPNATLKQIVSAANILKTDMGNRHQAYQDQIDDIKKRTGAKKETQQSDAHIIKLNGKRYQYKGSGDTADINNYSLLQ